MAGALLILAGMAVMLLGAAVVGFAPAKYRWYGAVLAVLPVIGFGWNWYLHRNPYSRDGLMVEWRYGASSSYPSVEVWVDLDGQRIECPVVFGGIRDPDLVFDDYNWDGRRDLVFGNPRQKQVVAFFPGYGDQPPRFVVLRDDLE